MWNAALYNKLSKERLQPSIDLVNRISGNDFRRILDVGCGTGLSSGTLYAQWPNAEITGVDLSAEMLEKARQTMETVTWLQRDCSKPLDDLGIFDLVFSNAFLQWLRNQEEFLRNVRKLLGNSGILALQVPDFKSMPACDCINKVTAAYGSIFHGIEKEIYTNNAIEDYYDILKRYYSSAEVWKTGYYHVMISHEAILEFIKGTALRPHLERLDDGKAGIFLQSILEELKSVYPIQEDGTILFEFKRMFFVAEI